MWGGVGGEGEKWTPLRLESGLFRVAGSRGEFEESERDIQGRTHKGYMMFVNKPRVTK